MKYYIKLLIEKLNILIWKLKHKRMESTIIEMQNNLRMLKGVR